MKRTSVDIIGEYYDNQEDLMDSAYGLGVRPSELRKIFQTKKAVNRSKLEE